MSTALRRLDVVAASPFPQRLVNDFKRLQQDPPIGVNASPDPNNIMQWTAIIFGPEDTCW